MKLNYQKQREWLVLSWVGEIKEWKKKTTGDKSSINFCHTPHKMENDLMTLLAT